TERLTVGTCFGSNCVGKFSLQGYMDVFTPGPETSSERQARAPCIARLGIYRALGTRLQEEECPLPDGGFHERRSRWQQASVDRQDRSPDGRCVGRHCGTQHGREGRHIARALSQTLI